MGDLGNGFATLALRSSGSPITVARETRSGMSRGFAADRSVDELAAFNGSTGGGGGNGSNVVCATAELLATIVASPSITRTENLNLPRTALSSIVDAQKR
jgi:hypothetical protein